MAQKILETEIAIVGSGTAGATLAKELSKAGKKVLLIEKGARETRLGRMRDGLRFYEKHTFQKSIDGTLLYGTNMVGGTSVVASGNALRCSQKELLDLGIDLESHFIDAERELNAAPLPDKCISPGALKLLESAEALGLGPKRIPKFINPNKCRICGHCVMGCKYNAKWSAANYVDAAVKNGASLMTKTRVTRVLSSHGRVQGLEAIGPDGQLKIMSHIVIVSCGGLQTPILLQRSGITRAGRQMFCDPWMTTYGITKNLNQVPGVNAPGYVHKPGRFILFPVIDPPIQFMLYTGLRPLSGRFPRERALGLMTKIADDSAGKVNADGSIEKPITSQDKEKFNEGNRLVREILIKAGADPKSLFTMKQIRGPHPGGTAAIGEVVDNMLETEIKNLFVCDNSVLPKAPGLPPILTLIALSKWLAKRLAADNQKL
ncbi:MAG: GMC family oxidoreductase [Candidatus Omnitrophota bacterium]